MADTVWGCLGWWLHAGNTAAVCAAVVQLTGEF